MDNIRPSDLQWLTVLLTAATLHGFWLSILLFSKKWKQLGARLLGLAFVIVSLHLVNYLLFLSGVIRSVPHSMGVIFPLLFLLGPCFYFFVKNAVEPSFRFRLSHLWHMLLPILAFFNTLKLYTMPARSKLKIIENFLVGDWSFTWLDVLLGSGYLIQWVVYVAAAWWLVKKTEAHQAAPENRRNVHWYRQFCLGFLMLLTVDLAIRFFFFAMRWPAPVLEMAIASVVAFTIQLAGYQVIGKLWDFPMVKLFAPKEKGNGKYRTSPLTPEQMEKYRDMLLEKMKNEMPFLDASLKISDLAAQLDIPSHHLSQVLNDGMGTSYYDFVNSFRVETAKRRLRDENFQHYSILAIGLECGFANKTTFNRTFKKMTGMTPSEFAKGENISLG